MSLEKEAPLQGDSSPERYANEQGDPGFDDDDAHVGCPAHTTERKLMTKIDLHLLPVLCVLYLLAFLDR
jgi:hypothetical protein